MNHTIQKNRFDCQRSSHIKPLNFTLYGAVWKVLQLLCMIKKYNAISKQRQELFNLTDDQLDDIGINREHAMREAKKPFWK